MNHGTHVDAIADQALSPEEKLRQAVDMMATGLRWKRAALAREHPEASPEHLERLFRQWLLDND